MKETRQIPAHSPGVPLLRRFLRRFLGANRASAAVEFALVGIPFFLLLFAMIETGMIFFATSAVEHATVESARLIRTGQAQKAGFDEDGFKQQICDRLSWLPNCLSSLHIDVRTFDAFADVNFPDPMQDGEMTGQYQFQPGSAGDIVLVRSFYEWPVFTPASVGLSNMATDGRLLVASTAFRNEPF